MKRVVALVACHNRKDRTVGCFESYFAQEADGIDVSAVLVDDGSTDGTSEVVRERFPRVTIVPSDGSLYWARAMALAEACATGAGPEFLLWLNDDVVLYRSALRTLLATAGAAGEACVVAGYTVDPTTRRPSYGGADRVDWHPLRFRLTTPADGRAVATDTFNGNVVLVPRRVYQALGGIDGGFEHAFADFDYGLRARKLGFEVVVAGAPVGECRRNTHAPWRDASLSLVDRFRLLLGPKGVPIGSSARYLRRHGGRLWPIYFGATYVKATTDHVRTRIRGPRREPLAPAEQSKSDL